MSHVAQNVGVWSGRVCQKELIAHTSDVSVSLSIFTCAASCLPDAGRFAFKIAVCDTLLLNTASDHIFCQIEDLQNATAFCIRHGRRCKVLQWQWSTRVAVGGATATHRTSPQIWFFLAISDFEKELKLTYNGWFQYKMWTGT